MINNPIDTDAFTHWLLFESLGKTVPYQIIEPDGFKMIAFGLKQNSSRWSRDYSYIACGDKAVRFNDATGRLGTIEQVINPKGDTSYYLDHGLAWILESDRRFGFNSMIKYVLKKDGLQFDAGYLSCAAKDTDGYTYFACNIVQDPSISTYKKRETEKINMFGTKDFKNQTITPAPTIDFLRKALPIYKRSTWSSKTADQAMASRQKSGSFTPHFQTLVNTAISLDIDELDYSLSSSDAQVSSDGAGHPVGNALAYFRAKNKTTDIVINITNLAANTFSRTDPGVASASGSAKLVIKWGVSASFAETEVLYQRDFINEDSTTEIVPTEYTFTIPLLDIGSSIWIYFVPEADCEFEVDAADFTAYSVFCIMLGGNIEITATETALNTVVKGVRLIDAQRQCSKYLKNIPINAPKWDFGGKFYNQVIWNRSCVSQNTTVPFVTSFGDCLGQTQEVCGDYENLIDEIFQGEFHDFYTQDEIGVFPIKTSQATKDSWNELALINSFKLAFEKYQDDSNLSQNTLEDIHTEAEWSIPNEGPNNSLERTFKYTRSGYSKEKAVSLEINKPTTSDSTDDDVFIDDLVPLSPDASYSWGATLAMNIVDGLLVILNRAYSADSEEVVINWTILGIKAGDQFFIVAGANIGEYRIESITNTILILRPQPGTVPIAAGNFYGRFKYFYTNVSFTTSTNEDFSLVDGISNAAAYPSLKKSLRRLFEYWGSIINTACEFILESNPDAVIKNSYFKSNGKLRTRLLLTDPILTENGDIPISSLPEKIITSRVFDIECYATFEQAITFFENYRLKRGFVRTHDLTGMVLKGYAKDVEYTFSTGKLKLQIEQKYEPSILPLTFSGGILNVGATSYAVGGNSDWWTLENGWFTAYDSNNVPICNATMYNKVSLNGTIYESWDALNAALRAL